ncbi:MAG: HipA domain-containing protein [Deltaproteobacteria bacterium]|nr:HipA domain-containing protein [Deltaproteobacteria bacterium]
MTDSKKCLKCLLPLETGSTPWYGLHEPCFVSWFGLEKPEEFTGIERRSESGAPKASDKTKGWNTSFFHGKFRKYSAILAGDSYIFKMKQEEAPELPDVEFVCNQIARSTGLPVPDFYHIEFHGERAFVTKNFVKRSTTATLNHIYHYLSETDRYDCATIANVIAQTSRPYDVDIFVRACLFDSLIGNHDRHGRNLAFIATPKGNSLAPIYDNPSALGIETGTILQAEFAPKGKIWTKNSKEPTAKDYVGEFRRLNHEDSVRDFFARVDIDKILGLVWNSACSDLMKSAFSRLLARRYEEMKNAIEQGSKSA